jgi:hypothetical protein
MTACWLLLQAMGGDAELTDGLKGCTRCTRVAQAKSTNSARLFFNHHALISPIVP